MNRKINVAFIYNKNWGRLDPISDTAKMEYNLYLNTMRNHPRLNVRYYAVEGTIDISTIAKADIILLPDNYHIGSPKQLENIKKSNTPVICKVSDPHDSQWTNRFDYHEKYKIDCYFGIYTPQYFYKFYPKEWRFKHIFYGLEPSHYKSIPDFKPRIKNKILLTGAIGNLNPLKIMYRRVVKPRTNTYIHYKLRTKCKNLPYVDYKRNMNYVELLSKYRSAIAATTVFPTTKYLENPAAGCLTFMEITEKNNGGFLGFRDGENAVFIDEKNYKKKFQEYLQDVDNPKWEEIAMAGREYVMNNLTNHQAMDKLIDLMEEYVK